MWKAWIVKVGGHGETQSKQHYVIKTSPVGDKTACRLLMQTGKQTLNDEERDRQPKCQVCLKKIAQPSFKSKGY